MTDDEFLNIINVAERSIKIFIYPVIKDHQLDEKYLQHGVHDILPHFKSEYLFRNYLRHFLTSEKVDSVDPRNSMIVTNPEEANAFLIDHDWMRFVRNKCNDVIDYHIGPIIRNVIENYPYYNRSHGRDHFIFNVYDKGAFCDMECSDKGDKSVLFKISNASFIGNYGMDIATFYDINPNNTNELILNKKYQSIGIPCHRAGHDIVIPQLIQDDAMALHKIYARTHIPYREFDSSFAGCSWGERGPVTKMFKTVSEDYVSKRTENFIFLDGGSPDHSLKYRGYFMYHPCGLSCWSQRLYEALAVYTIPIIVTDGTIQAFERFINWSTFSVKISLNTWFTDSKRDEFRTRIRNESDLFRSSLIQCWKDMNISVENITSIYPGDVKTYRRGDGYARNILANDLRQSRIDWLIDDDQKIVPQSCQALKRTFYWKKSKAVQRIVPWLDFSRPHDSTYNAFRILTLEMWCRVAKFTSNATVPSVCDRPVDYSSRLEYF